MPFSEAHTFYASCFFDTYRIPVTDTAVMIARLNTDTVMENGFDFHTPQLFLQCHPNDHTQQHSKADAGGQIAHAGGAKHDAQAHS